MLNIAIFASGSGTNAENIINNFNGSISPTNNSSAEGKICVKLVICNNPHAGVIQKAKNAGVETIILNKATLCENSEGELIKILRERKIDFIVLAGYLLLIPSSLIALYHNKIVNIHPSLLPAYGGKGMYGHYVHQAVLKDKTKSSEPMYSGITIHLVDEQFDHGKILFQSKFLLSEDETIESLEKKIHIQEQAHFPQVLESYIKNLFHLIGR